MLLVRLLMPICPLISPAFGQASPSCFHSFRFCAFCLHCIPRILFMSASQLVMRAVSLLSFQCMVSIVLSCHSTYYRFSLFLIQLFFVLSSNATRNIDRSIGFVLTLFYSCLFQSRPCLASVCANWEDTLVGCSSF